MRQSLFPGFPTRLNYYFHNNSVSTLPINIINRQCTGHSATELRKKALITTPVVLLGLITHNILSIISENDIIKHEGMSNCRWHLIPSKRLAAF